MYTQAVQIDESNRRRIKLDMNVQSCSGKRALTRNNRCRISYDIVICDTKTAGVDNFVDTLMSSLCVRLEIPIIEENESTRSQPKKGAKLRAQPESVLIIGDSLIKNIDSQKLTKKTVNKRMYPGKTSDQICHEVDSIHIDVEPSHVIIHSGTNNSPSDSVESCVSKTENLALKIRKSPRTGKRLFVVNVVALVVTFSSSTVSQLLRTKKRLFVVKVVPSTSQEGRSSVFVDAPGDDHFPCCWIVPSTNFFKVSKSLLQIRRSPLSRRFSSSGPSCLIENNSTVVFSKEPLSEVTPRPLDPRDAFFGGRTNAYQLYRCVEGDERILYYDFKSLYPYVNKYCRYPIGHPHIISQPPLDQGLDAYFGLVCCTILPPTDLLHPVLPYRCSQKLTFPLCAACVRQYIGAPLLDKNVDDCHHTDAQRALTGTWCTPELAVALQKGYRLLHIHQIYRFPDTQVGLFAEYIDTWLKLKEEASGYPDHCTTGHLQREHVRRWKERENIVLRHANIRKNPGQRALAKLMLNSMWGKFGKQTNKTQVKEFIDPPEFWHFLDSSAHDVRWVSAVTEERVEIHYKMQHHCESDSPNLNIFVAFFTTCHARLHLYRALDHLGPRVLYSDTDSIVFVQGPNDPPVQPPLGDFLGDFTDELDPGDHIVEFCSGGPKNYGYLTARGKTECKVRGFSLNAKGQAQLNYQVLKQNTLDELRAPRDQPRVTPIVQTHSVHRDAKQYQLSTRSRTKDYKLVYNKRILDPPTFYTFPSYCLFILDIYDKDEVLNFGKRHRCVTFGDIEGVDPGTSDQGASLLTSNRLSFAVDSQSRIKVGVIYKGPKKLLILDIELRYYLPPSSKIIGTLTMLPRLEINPSHCEAKHEMGFMYAVLPKTCLGCKGVVVSLGDVNVWQTSLYADYDTKTQKLR
ncbi:hypothetical protein P5673_026364 [Acropora cervicornis]|uniref:DNA-directed DNA polymerase n=1 Tax=Acropora cervicornis TaxID=6130 RepID=A0AAD9Q0P6_ACRCE|nr:hypothetical protein P5673_026364 [Acropora cervicornis]